MMELRVGPDIDVMGLYRALQNTNGYHIMETRWQAFAQELLTEDKSVQSKIAKFEFDINHKTKDANRVILDIIYEWLMLRGVSATVAELHDALKSCTLTAAAEAIRQHVEASNTLNDVDQNDEEFSVPQSYQSQSYKKLVSISDNKRRASIVTQCSVTSTKNTECQQFQVTISCGDETLTKENYAYFIEELESHLKSEMQLEYSPEQYMIESTMQDSSGEIIINCCNSVTADWVLRTSNTIISNTDNNIPLSDSTVNRKHHTYESCISGEPPDESELIKTLNFQNPKIGANHYDVLGISKEKGVKKRFRVIIRIPDHYISELEKIDYRPFYLTRRMGILKRVNDL